MQAVEAEKQMKVGLIHPKMFAQAYDFFPLGIGYIASALDKRDIPFSFYDLHKDWMTVEKLVEKIKEDGVPQLFGLSALLTSLPNTMEICKGLKAHFPDVKIVLGGKISVLDAKFIFRKVEVDFIIRGEGEEAMIDLIEAIQGKREYSSIKGLSFKEEDGSVCTKGEQTDPIKDLGEFPFPYKKFDMAKYVTKFTVQSPKKMSVNMLSSRGCPFSCTFCNFSLEEDKSMRYYPLDQLSDYWDHLIENCGLKHVTFNDDIFTVNRKRLKEILDVIKEKDMTFSCSTRLDCLTEDTIELLADAGCAYLCCGIESPSPTVAKIIDKRLDLVKFQHNMDLLLKSSITVNFGFIYAYYGETEQTIQETREFIMRNKLIYAGFFATAFPGTALYEQVKHLIDDEEEYLMRLGSVDLSADLLVNFTEIPRKKLLRMRDELIADSLINAVKINVPMKPVTRQLFMMYLWFMRTYGVKTMFFKRVFEIINISIVKPLVGGETVTSPSKTKTA